MIIVTISIVIALFFAACNQSVPIDTDTDQCVDNYDIGYDEAEADMMLELEEVNADNDDVTADLQQQINDVKSVLAGVIAERDNFKQLLWAEQADYMELKKRCEEVQK